MVTPPSSGPSLADRAVAPAVAPLPHPRLRLTWRALEPADVPALAALVEAIEEADDPPYRTTAEEVGEWLTGSWKDLGRDTLAGFDPAGELRAFALAEVPPGDVSIIRAYLHGGVHPDRRGRGVGRALLAWMDARGRQLVVAAGKDAPARLITFLEADAAPERRLFAAAGYAPQRWYTTMRRDLAQQSSKAALPAGVRLAPWRPELDDAVRRAHNEAFADHWGSQPQTPEQWTAGRSAFAPQWSFALLDEASDVVGYLMSARFEQDWPVLGYTFGYVEKLGVLRAWRGRGLAGALLGAAMDAYRADGMAFAELDVDTENPTGAVGLYARLGFEPTHGSVMYSIEL